MESSRSCLVCGSDITRGHAGVDACRACALFFKRTATTGKHYPCRQDHKFGCRSCRFKKCLTLDMTIDTTESQKSETKITPAVPSEDMASARTDATEKTLLGKILCEKSCQRRRAQELHFAKLFNLSKSNHPDEEYFISNVRHNFESCRVLVMKSFQLVCIIYPNIHEYSKCVMVSLCKCFIKYSVVENYYLTQRHWRHTSYFVVSLIPCFDLANASEWVSDGDNIPFKDDLVQFLARYTAEYTTFLMSIRKTEEIGEREFAALIALSFCDIDATQEVPEEALKQSEAVRAKVFAELQVYYREELKLKECPIKLGGLMAMLHTMIEASTVLAEEFRMYSYLFGVCASDILLRELFIQ